MAKQKSSVDSLSSHLEKLVSDRQHHADAIAMIDETLSKVSAALTAVGGRATHQPAAMASSSHGGEARAPRRKGTGKRRGRGSYEMTAEQFVINFVQGHDSPSTQEINKEWKGNGRRGSADNTLSKAVRDGKLTRTSLEGRRGSTYVVA